MVGMGNTRFRWNAAKRMSNLEKHGIDFQDAIMIFGNDVLILPSPREGEMRWLAIGRIDREMLAVAYTKRDGKRRIISARQAHKNERKKYYKHVSRGSDPS